MRTTIIGYVSLISVRRSIGIQTVLRSLKLLLNGGVSNLAFMYGLVSEHTSASAIAIRYVSIISI